jgi:hypothetical protein
LGAVKGGREGARAGVGLPQALLSLDAAIHEINVATV